MKIGILTFHASHNYGSMLQAWALQHYLNCNSYDAQIINLRIKDQRNFYRFPLIPPKNNRREYIYSFFNPISIYHACRKWMRYERFLGQYLLLTNKQYNSWEEVKDDIEHLGYGCIITGGDQIWNMNCIDFSKSYFLPADLGTVKKISYSPSFGGTFLNRISSEQEAFIKEALSDYSYISVRETSMQQYLSGLLHREVQIACDPTLLLVADDYSRFIGDKPIVDGDYIFYYTPTRYMRGEALAQMIGSHLGMKVVTSFPHIRRNRMVTVSEAGPAEFLNLVKNAKLIIGKSFHLVVFSLLFHKEFIAIDGDNDARMKSLLDVLGIPERGLVTEDNFKSIQLLPIDFQTIDIMLAQERERSQRFIQKALE